MTKKMLKAEGARLSIYLDGPDWEGETAATIGDFSCQSPEAGATLLSDAISEIRAAGRRRILGPMSGDTWHSYRFVTDSDGSPPFLLEPTNAPHEREVFHAAGFTPVSRYFSSRLPLALADTTPSPPTDAFAVEVWDGEDPEGLFRQVHGVSVRAFAGNAFYKPIAEDEFLAMYMPVVPMMKRELILFARRTDGSLAGFLFAIPNYAEGPETRTVIFKTYASLERGAGRHLFHACHSRCRTMGYETIIHALIHDANQSGDRSAEAGAEVFRRYELLGLRLDG